MNDDNNTYLNNGDASGMSIDDILYEYYSDSPFFSHYEEPVYDIPSDSVSAEPEQDAYVPGSDAYLPDYSADDALYAPEEGGGYYPPASGDGRGYSVPDPEDIFEEEPETEKNPSKRGGSLKSVFSIASGKGKKKSGDRSGKSAKESQKKKDFRSSSVADIFAEEPEEYGAAYAEAGVLSQEPDADSGAYGDAYGGYSEVPEHDAPEFLQEEEEIPVQDSVTGEDSDYGYYSSDLDSIIASLNDVYAPSQEIEDMFRPEPEPERAPTVQSSLPGDSDVREYLDSLTSADFLSFISEEETSPEPVADVPTPELDPDDRFHLGGYSRQYMQYGDREIDVSYDASYAPPSSDSYSPPQWTPPSDGSDEAPSFPKFPGFGKRKARGKDKVPEKAAAADRASEEALSDDLSGFAPEPGAGAAVSDDSADSGFEQSFREFDFSGSSGYDRETGNLKTEEDEDDFFPSSFKDYLTTVFNTVLVRLGKSGGKTKLIHDEVEDLGPELSAKAASKYYGSFSRSIRNRLRLSFVVLVVMAWVSLGLPVSGAIKDCRVLSLLCLALQLAMMVLCLDTVTAGIMNAVRARPGAETMVVASCFITSLDALVVGVTSFSSAHVPLCLLSSLSLFGAELASLFNCRGLRKALRVPAIGRRSYAVSAEPGVKKEGVTLLKSFRSLSGLVHRAEEASPDDMFFRKLCIPAAILCALFTLITAAVKHAMNEFIFIFSAIFAPAVPVAALLCFSMPFLTGSVRLFKNGAAIAGWAGAADIGKTKNLIITDIDLFPDSCTELDGVLLFSDSSSEKIISYAGTIISASGCGLAPCFGALMEKNGCRMRNIEIFEPLAGGGFKGVIDGDVVLCGNSALMRLMNVKVPSRRVTDTSVLLAINGVLYGIFNIKYTANQQVRAALLSLVRSDRHPIFAIRDFNVTPDMLRKTFDIPTDGYDFPAYLDRFTMTENRAGDDSRIAAVVCREGLPPVVKAAETGHSVYRSVLANLYVTAAGIFFGIITVFVKLLSAGSVSVAFLCAHALLWLLPVVIISVFFVR